MQTVSLRAWFWAGWLTLGATRCALALHLPLLGDEAWYWLEGQRLAWAYSDLPGLTAWLARLGVETLGHSTLGLRWPFIALSMAVPLLIRASAARHADEHAGEVAGLWSLLLPLLGVMGLLALPDVPLTFASALCLYACMRLVRGVDRAAVVWLSLGLALGALSHYRFAILLVAGGVGMLLDVGGRRALRHPLVWTAIGVGALAWLPLLIWNLQHDGAGVQFQVEQRHPWRLHGEGIRLPLYQLVVAGPAMLLLFFAALRRLWREREGAGTGLLLGSALVPLVAYLLLAFVTDRERVTFHWMLQGYLPLLLVVPAIWSGWSARLRIAALAMAFASFLLPLVYIGAPAVPVWRAALVDSRWYPDNFVGWDDVAAAVRNHVGEDARPLVADNFMLGAQLGFALQRTDLQVLDHPLNHKHGRSRQLRIWAMQTSQADARAASALLVVEDTALPLRLRLVRDHALCDGAGPLPSPDVLSIDRGRKRFLLHDLSLPSSQACTPPAYAWIDAPRSGAQSAEAVIVDGWAFKDGVGLARVEILVDGEPVADAEYGLDRPHVADFWRISTDPSHPRVGFRAQLAPGTLREGTRWLGLRLHGNDGSIEHWPDLRLQVEAP